MSVRPMELAERQQFAGEVMTFLRSGMERAGVLAGAGAALDELEERVARLADDPPPEGELLVMGLVDGEPVGRAWATLVTDDDGSVDFRGNTIDLFPQFRGQGLTRSFLGALVATCDEIGVRDIHLRVYAHDAGARRTFVDTAPASTPSTCARTSPDRAKPDSGPRSIQGGGGIKKKKKMIPWLGLA